MDPAWHLPLENVYNKSYPNDLPQVTHIATYLTVVAQLESDGRDTGVLVVSSPDPLLARKKKRVKKSFFFPVTFLTGE